MKDPFKDSDNDVPGFSQINPPIPDGTRCLFNYKDGYPVHCNGCFRECFQLAEDKVPFPLMATVVKGRPYCSECYPKVVEMLKADKILQEISK